MTDSISAAKLVGTGKTNALEALNKLKQPKKTQQAAAANQAANLPQILANYSDFRAAESSRGAFGRAE